MIWNVYDKEHVVTQLQPELFTLRAQDAAESGFADAVRASNSLATAQVRKDTPSLIDVKGLGRPKEFIGREEDFQRWSKKTEAFFAGVIQESQMMMELAAEQPTEITTAFLDLTSCEANYIVAISRKNPLEAWRRLQKRYHPTTGGRKRNHLRTIISLGRCSLLELQAGIGPLGVLRAALREEAEGQVGR